MQTSEQHFAQLVKEHKSTIYSVCYLFSNNQDEVADLFQETLINLWKGMDTFRADSQISTWIYRVAMNTCISYDRQRKARVGRVPLSIDIDLYKDTDKDTQQVKMLYDRIHQLDLLDRAIVMLWLENMSYEEIGAIVGMSVKNVSVRLVRIKEKLMNQH